MQNKGFIKFLAVMLTLICLFYLSFSFVTSHVEGKADKMDAAQREQYLDSMNVTPFYMGHTLKECRQTAIGLGLDLQGGMNAILEVSVPDVIKNLADNSIDPDFTNAMEEAKKEAGNDQSKFLPEFVKAYKKSGKPLTAVFANTKMRGKVDTNSSDADVEKILSQSIQEAVDNSYLVLRTRIDRLGVVQPNIQKIEGQSGRILVELPGIGEEDIERAEELLQGSANLEFWETYDAKEVTPYLYALDRALKNGFVEEEDEDGAVAAANDTTSAASDTTAAAVAATEEKVDSTDKAKELIAGGAAVNADANGDANAAAQAANEKDHPLLSQLYVYQNAAGCAVGAAHKNSRAKIDSLLATDIAKDVLAQFPELNMLSLKWDVNPNNDKDKIYTLYAIRVTLDGKAPIEGDVVTETKGETNQFNKPVVTMAMNSEGARKWSELTGKNVGHCVAVVLDDVVYSAPNVNSKIDGGRTEISGNFTVEETKELATVLQSGRMPARATVIQSDIIGPTLGQQSINAGIISCIIAFIVLMIYMVIMYGVREGMVANCALMLNFFFSLGILTSLGAALTMSGIAGMVLTLGMAVDANVLIYERTKEEMKAGKRISEAVAEGYGNAFSAIFDSNVTTILTGIILFNFGTGPIKGFATTLIIGIICSFFTAVWMTRIVYEHFLNRGKWQNLKFTTPFSKNLMQGTNVNFMGHYKKSFIGFGIAVVVALGSLAVRGLSQSIDFTGGRDYYVSFENQVKPETVKSSIVKIFNENKTEGETVKDPVVTSLGTDGKRVKISTNFRLEDDSATADAAMDSLLTAAFEANGVPGNIESAQKVGPAIAKDITQGAILSICFAIAVIFVYILIRFRNVAYSVGSIVALIIDTLLVIGMFSLCYGWIGFSLDIDQTFIGAILTVIGYSINDKVVVFDRIRESFANHPKRDLQRIFNESLNSTLARTINTSVSTFIVLLVIFVLGGESIRAFAFAMILGVIIGTSSSLFIAAPTAYLVMGARIKEADVNEETVASEVAKN